VFPIFDSYGRVVGFGGRVLGDESSGPKYLNSPETPVYSKGRNLYGLYQGRNGLRTRGQAVIVEGYMDVVGCHQAGADYAVAPLGTAFTTDQALLLKRYVQEVILLFDPDDAGTRASWRSADVLLQSDLFVRVAHVAGGKDPDELVLEKGLSALDETLRAAKDVADFWLDDISRTSPHFDSLHARVRQAQEFLAFVKAVPNEMLRREWVKKVATRLSLDEGSLRRELHKISAVAAKRAAAAAPPPAARPAPKPAEERRAPHVRSLEEEILQLFCNHAEAWPRLPEVPAELFHDPRCERVFSKLLAQWKERGAVELGPLLAELPPEDAAWFSALAAEEKKFDDPHETLGARLKRLELVTTERERRTLEKEVLQMLEGRIPRDETKISRYQSLTRLLKGVVRAEAKSAT